MNIFYLDKCPTKSAEYMIDAHVGSKTRSAKMLVEYSQMLANCYSHEELKNAPLTQKGTVRKYSYFNHPCSIWVRKSCENFNWLVQHASASCIESVYRGGKKHFCIDFIDWCHNNPAALPKTGFTKPAQAMPPIFYNKCSVEAYRDYYQHDKIYDNAGKFMATWTNRNIPFWFDESKLKK